MRESRNHVRPEAESLESRMLPTAIIPTLTLSRLRSTDGEVRRIMGSLARNNGFNAAGNDLVAQSSNIPFGRRGLADAWRDELSTVDSNVRGSGLDARRHMIRDLYQYVRAGVLNREFRVVGAGSRVFYQPGVSTPTGVISINFTNKTNVTLTVGGYTSNRNLLPGSLVTLKSGENKDMRVQGAGQPGVWTGIKVPPQTNFVYFSALPQNGLSYNITNNGGMWLVQQAG